MGDPERSLQEEPSASAVHPVWSVIREKLGETVWQAVRRYSINAILDLVCSLAILPSDF